MASSLTGAEVCDSDSCSEKHHADLYHNVKPIGYLRSVFKFKNGTPRQSGLSSTAKGYLQISKEIFNNPEHSLQGLSEYSHVWLIFIFHKNNNVTSKAKVKPPRLNGEKLGVFATRSPYRPNPIGLTLAKLESIEGSSIILSGIDLIDGTPVIDIKPFIPSYDSVTCFPATSSDESSSEMLTLSRPSNGGWHDNVKKPALAAPSDIKTADWLSRTTSLEVAFTSRADSQLQKFSATSKEEIYKLQYFSNPLEARTAIIEVLKADPRSAYRKQNCEDTLYYFTVDNIHITCWFDDNLAEVLKVQPLALSKLSMGSQKQ